MGQPGEPDNVARPDDLRVLYRLTDSLYRANGFEEIFDAAIEAITAALGSRASILLFDDKGVMRFAAWRGLSDRYRTALEGHSPWLPSDMAPDPICVSNISAASEPDHVKQIIRSEGITALAFIPILARRRVTGKFMTYYEDEHDFTPDEVNLAVSIARQIGFCIERMRAEEALRESEERFRKISEEAPVMLWMSDANGHCVHLNRLLRMFWGVQNEDLSKFNWATSLHPEDVDRVIGAMQNAGMEKKGLSVEARYRNSDGAYRLLSTNAQPRYAFTGEFLGMIGVNIDVTEHREAEAALRESEERLRIALAAGRMGTWRHELSTGAQSWDQRQYELFGLDKTTIPTVETFMTFVHPADRDAVTFDLSALEKDFLDSEFRIRRSDGSLRWISAHSAARRDDLGNPVEIIGVNIDVTSQKEAESELRLLLDELNHRVKNTLAVVQAIAHQTFRGSATDQAARRAFEGRLIALSAAHNLLTQSNWEGAALSEVVTDSFRAQSIDAARVQLAGPPIDLEPKQALALSLAFHELCTNAVKYGALSDDGGHVSVVWSLSDERRIQICWTEAGGPPVAPPSRRGFGSMLIEKSLARDLDASVDLDFSIAGLRCTIDVPTLHEPPEGRAS